MRKSAVVSCGLVLIGVFASTAEAATLTVGKGKTYETIGAAVEVAAENDTIVVYRGTYTENVFSRTPGLKLLARPGVRWLPAQWGGRCLTLAPGAAGTSVTGFSFSSSTNWDTAIVTVDAPRVTFSRCRFRGGTALAGVGADDLLVSRCDIRHGSQGVSVSGDRVKLDRSVVAQHDDSPVEITGDDATISRVAQKGSENNPGFFVRGDRATIDRCSTRATWNHGVHVIGDDCVVRNSQFTETNNDPGIEVTGDRASIESNEISLSVRYPGIVVNGLAFTVRGNRIRSVGDGLPGLVVDNGSGGGGTATVADNDVMETGGDGIDVRGAGVNVTGNRVGDVVGVGYLLAGTGHRLDGNVVVGAGRHGFQIESQSTELYDCEARECEIDGFAVGAVTAIVLDGCRAFGSAADGFHCVDGSGVTLRGCKFTGNRQDIAAPDGALTLGAGNAYVTGGPGSPSID